MRIYLKYILVFFCGVFLYTPCFSNGLQESDNELYEVYKIDSINNYYLIYLRKGENKYKVVSKMEFRMQAEKIELKKRYHFNLESIYNVDVCFNGTNFNPAHVIGLDCISVDVMTNVCIEKNDSIYDIFKATNLAGLYLK